MSEHFATTDEHVEFSWSWCSECAMSAISYILDVLHDRIPAGSIEFTTHGRFSWCGQCGERHADARLAITG